MFTFLTFYREVGVFPASNRTNWKLCWFHGRFVMTTDLQPCTSNLYELQDLSGNSTEKLYQVRKGLAVELMHLCPTCRLTVANIKDDEFSCRGGLTNFIVYRARMVGTDVYSAPGLVSLMQSWVGSDRASIAIQSSSRLHLDASCPTSLDTLRSPDCPFISRPPVTTTVGAPETKPTTKKPEEKITTVKPPPSEERTGLSASARAGEIGGIFIGVLVVLLLVVVIVLLSVILLKRWKPSLPRIRWVCKSMFVDVMTLHACSQEGGMWVCINYNGIIKRVYMHVSKCTSWS